MDSSSTAWRYFESVAENYSQVAHFRLWSAIKILERRGLMELVPDFAGKSIRVLELGAGTGYYSGELLKMSQSHLCAVDFSAKMLERHPYACEKILADIEAMPGTLRARSFDLVFCAGAFEFLANPARVLAHLASMQAKAAVLVFTLPCRNPLARAYRWFHGRHGMDIKCYGAGEIAEMAVAAGYRVGMLRPIPPFNYGVQLIRL